MKNTTKKILSIMLALTMLLTGIMIPRNTEKVQAASKVIYFGYDTYVEYVEAMGANMDATKKSVNDASHRVSGYNIETEECEYYTYAEVAEMNGFIIPSNCIKILVTGDGIPLMGYQADGTRVRIYNIDGYDFFGYNSKYKSREGRSAETPVKKIAQISFGCEINFGACRKTGNWNELSSQLRWKEDREKQFSSVWVYDKGGNEVDESHYNVQVKPIAVNKKGYGTYKVSVKGDVYYGNTTFTKTVKILPILKVLTIADRADDNYLYNYRYYIAYSHFYDEYSYVKNKDIKGIEYQIGELKSKKKGTGKNAITIYYKDNFAKNSKKGTIVFSKAKAKMIKNKVFGEKGFLLAAINKKSYNKAYELKYRTYIIVNGKKIYSDWYVSISEPSSGKYKIQ